MSRTYAGGFITVNAIGTTVTTGAASANVAIPTDSSGNLPRYIRISATTESYVRLGVAGVVATANGLLIQPADSEVVSVNGNTFIAHIQGTASGKVNITPLENC
jgi:hypothetical protein